MSKPNEWIEELQRNISDLIANSPAADIERNVKALMAQTFARMDLITREEFDIQQQLLSRLSARVSELEAKVSELESK